jgi:hypothetical protein
MILHAVECPWIAQVGDDGNAVAVAERDGRAPQFERRHGDQQDVGPMLAERLIARVGHRFAHGREVGRTVVRNGSSAHDLARRCERLQAGRVLGVEATARSRRRPRQDDHFVPESRQMAGKGDRPLGTGSTVRREVVGNEQDPHGGAPGILAEVTRPGRPRGR